MQRISCDISCGIYVHNMTKCMLQLLCVSCKYVRNSFSTVSHAPFVNYHLYFWAKFVFCFSYISISYNTCSIIIKSVYWKLYAYIYSFHSNTYIDTHMHIHINVNNTIDEVHVSNIIIITVKTRNNTSKIEHNNAYFNNTLTD